MDYVISPWFFYWVNVVDIIYGWFTAIAVLFGIISIIFLIIGLVNKYDAYDEKDLKRGESFLKNTKKTLIGFIIFILLSIFIPSKTTLIQMAIAKNITYSNLDKAGDKIKTNAKDLVDYILYKFKETKKEIKNKE